MATKCIICKKDHPGGRNAPGWSHLAGARPAGSVVCSDACMTKVFDNIKATGRADGRTDVADDETPSGGSAA